MMRMSTEWRSDESNLKKFISWLRPKARSRLPDSTEEHYSVLIQWLKLLFEIIIARTVNCFRRATSRVLEPRWMNCPKQTMRKCLLQCIYFVFKLSSLFLPIATDFNFAYRLFSEKLITIFSHVGQTNSRSRCRAVATKSESHAASFYCW